MTRCMSRDIGILRAVVWLALLVAPVSADELYGSNVGKEVESFIEATRKCRNIPGMTVAVVKGSMSLYAK